MILSDFITAIIVYLLYEAIADNDEAEELAQSLEIDISISFDDEG